MIRISLILLLLTGCAYQGIVWTETEPGLMEYKSRNADYDCRAEFWMRDVGRLKGCHVQLGSTHFIIYEDAESYEHEMRHVREGNWHD